MSRGLVSHRGRVLLHRAPAEARRLAGMAELPTLALLGVAARGAGVGPPASHRVRHLRGILHALPVTAADVRRWTRAAKLEWVPVAQLAAVAVTGPHLRWLNEWLNPPGRPARGTPP